MTIHYTLRIYCSDHDQYMYGQFQDSFDNDWIHPDCTGHTMADELVVENAYDDTE